MEKYKRLLCYHRFLVCGTYYFLDLDLNVVECCIKRILFKSHRKVYAICECKLSSTTYYDIVNLFVLGSKLEIVEKLERVSKKKAQKYKIQWPINPEHEKLFKEFRL